MVGVNIGEERVGGTEDKQKSPMGIYASPLFCPQGVVDRFDLHVGRGLGDPAPRLRVVGGHPGCGRYPADALCTVLLGLGRKGSGTPRAHIYYNI